MNREKEGADRADIAASQHVTPQMIMAGLLEFESRFPDVVFAGDDGERFVSRVFLAMLAKRQALPEKPS
jgi:hypothetical protein